MQEAKVNAGWQGDPEIWAANLAAWRARGGGRDLLPPASDQPPPLNRVTLVVGPYPAAQMPGDQGRLVSLNSPRDPWRDAEILTERLSVGESQTVVGLGMGLGYHLLKLLRWLTPQHQLIIVEPEPEIWLADLDKRDPDRFLNLSKNPGSHESHPVWSPDGATAPAHERDFARRYLRVDGSDFAWDLIRSIWSSVAVYAVTPMQDALSLGTEARMNFPSKLGGNWEWRMSEKDMNAELAGRLKELNDLYLR